MYCYYVCIGMKWLSLFILPEVHYATVDTITAGLLWQSPTRPCVGRCVWVCVCVCARVCCQLILNRQEVLMPCKKYFCNFLLFFLFFFSFLRHASTCLWKVWKTNRSNVSKVGRVKKENFIKIREGNMMSQQFQIRTPKNVLIQTVGKKEKKKN